jgi:predicted nucleic acid-binding protein
MERYYIDTSIWIDLYEDRKGYNGEPLGDYALRLFSLLSQGRNRLIMTNILFLELSKRFSLEQVRGQLQPFEARIDRIVSTPEEEDEAILLANERAVSRGDALHAILARDHQLILVARDRHFKKLVDVAPSYKPEDII